MCVCVFPSPGGLLEAGYIDPPFTPNKFDVNAASLKDIGDFDRAKYKHVKLDDRFKQRIRNFEYCSAKALQDEMSDTQRQDGSHPLIAAQLCLLLLKSLSTLTLLVCLCALLSLLLFSF
jgi:hypothetical protein